MTKKEIELTQAFNKLENTIISLQTLQRSAKPFYNVVWNYYFNYIVNIDDSLKKFKAKFYEALSENAIGNTAQKDYGNSSTVGAEDKGQSTYKG